jgi:hypothetical protein
MKADVVEQRLGVEFESIARLDRQRVQRGPEHEALPAREVDEIARAEAVYREKAGSIVPLLHDQREVAVQGTQDIDAAFTPRGDQLTAKSLQTFCVTLAVVPTRMPVDREDQSVRFNDCGVAFAADCRDRCLRSGRGSRRGTIACDEARGSAQ